MFKVFFFLFKVFWCLNWEIFYSYEMWKLLEMLKCESIPISDLPDAEVCEYFDLQNLSWINFFQSKCLKNADLQWAQVMLFGIDMAGGAFLLLFLPLHGLFNKIKAMGSTLLCFLLLLFIVNLVMIDLISVWSCWEVSCGFSGRMPVLQASSPVAIGKNLFAH